MTTTNAAAKKNGPPGTPALVKKLKKIETKLGELTLVASETALVGVYFPQHQPAPDLEGVEEGTSELLDQAARQITAYVAGEASLFTVPIAFEGTPLQESVWRALQAIPRGETRTYGELAASIGKKGSPRAIGQMVARNPLSIVVPCHRVLASGGKLNGFAGGIERKAALLALESAAFATPRPRRAKKPVEAQPALEQPAVANEPATLDVPIVSDVVELQPTG
jgi:methylated-DNA-[protein]-cysteine S-methyltransferase